MDCPKCDVEMITKSTSGKIAYGSRELNVTVEWEKCPFCNYIIDSSGTHLPPDSQPGPDEYNEL